MARGIPLFLIVVWALGLAQEGSPCMPSHFGFRVESRNPAGGPAQCHSRTNHDSSRCQHPNWRYRYCAASRKSLSRESTGCGFCGNGFGKLMGSTQFEEMGNIKAPIMLSYTTSVPRVADA